MIAFPGGSRYRILVLPNQVAMTPETLAVIKRLIEQGAVVIGNPPIASPSLVDYPRCDDRVKELAAKLWGDTKVPTNVVARRYGQGTIYWGGDLSPAKRTGENLYASYEATASILRSRGIPEDFQSSADCIRFLHRRVGDRDIYFLSNRTATTQDVTGVFRVTGKAPTLWHPNTGERRTLPEFQVDDNTMSVPLRFSPHESYFVVIDDDGEKSTARAFETSRPTKRSPVSRAHGQ